MPKQRDGDSRPTCIALDQDAFGILTRLAPHGKGYGRLVSELLRAEEQRRFALDAWRERQDQAAHPQKAGGQ